MKKINQFKDVISFWPSAADFGREIGVGAGSGRAMKNRNSISSKHWNSVINAAASRGLLHITHELLARIAGREGIAAPNKHNGHTKGRP